MGDPARNLLAVAVGIVVVKAYYDYLHFLYVRERMQVCKELMGDGLRLVERAIAHPTSKL